MTRYQKIDAKTIGDTQGKVKTKALLQTLAYMLAWVDAKHTVNELQSATLVRTQTATLDKMRH